MSWISRNIKDMIVGKKIFTNFAENRKTDKECDLFILLLLGIYRNSPI